MRYSEVETKVYVGDKIYSGMVATIKEASFGFMDTSTASPFASLHLSLEGRGWGIGDAFGRVLWHDRYAEENEYYKLGQSLEVIIKILRLFDATSVDKLKGKTVLSLWEDRGSSLGNSCVGLANPFTDLLSEDQIIIYDDLFPKE